MCVCMCEGGGGRGADREQALEWAGDLAGDDRREPALVVDERDGAVARGRQEIIRMDGGATKGWSECRHDARARWGMAHRFEANAWRRAGSAPSRLVEAHVGSGDCRHHFRRRVGRHDDGGPKLAVGDAARQVVTARRRRTNDL